MASEYLQYAQTAADVLTKNWFGPTAPATWVHTHQDFWRAPNAMTALNGLMELTGETTYQSTLDNGLSTFQQVVAGYPPGYYDDEAWWGAAFLRIYDRMKGQSYLDTTVSLFRDLSGGWDATAGGGVWFMRHPKSYPTNNKNSASTTLYFELAGRLYNGPATNASYLAAAKQAWAWLPRLIDRHSLVWGNLVPSGNTYIINQSNPARPYTQGTTMQGLLQLSIATRDDSLIDQAVAIADVTLDSMAWPGGVLRDTGEVIGDFRPALLDPILFKPIFARYLGELTVALHSMPGRGTAVQRYSAFLRANADALWANYPQRIFGMDWHLSQPDYQTSGVPLYDGSLQAGAVDLFVAAARVDALATDR